MKTTIEYLEAIKAKTGADSDNKLAQILGVTRQAISNYRNKNQYFDDETCLKIAQILEINDFEVILNTHAERSKNPLIKAAFATAFERIGGMAAAVTLGIMLNVPTPTQATERAIPALPLHNVPTIHYAK